MRPASIFSFLQLSNSRVPSYIFIPVIYFPAFKRFSHFNIFLLSRKEKSFIMIKISNGVLKFIEWQIAPS